MPLKLLGCEDWYELESYSDSPVIGLCRCCCPVFYEMDITACELNMPLMAGVFMLVGEG